MTISATFRPEAIEIMSGASSAESTLTPSSLDIRRDPSGQGMRLEATQFLPHSRDRVFAFFADAFQLETITPPWLKFEVLTPRPIGIVDGTLIDYRLSLHGIPLKWRSRISVWEPPLRFVDEQVRGPYRWWHHEHTFEEVPGGTLCRDVVRYAALGGRWIDLLFVRRDLRGIFEYRRDKLAVIFTT